MFDFLNRGFLMNEAGGDAGGGLATMDASSDFGDTGGEDISSTDGEVHDAEFTDDTPVEGTDQQASDTSTALVKAGEPLVIQNKLSNSGKAVIEAVKSLGPAVAQQITQALMLREWFKKQVPGGTKELGSMRTAMERIGGEQGISQLQEKSQALDRITELFDNANPEFVDQLTSDPERQAAFIKLMPEMLARLEKVSPDHAAYQYARAFTTMMDRGGIPTLFSTQSAILNRANQALAAGQFEFAAGFLSEIVEGHNQIAKILSAARTMQRPADPGSAKDPAMQTRASELDKREQNLRQQEWNGAVTGERRRVFQKTFAELSKGRNLTDEQSASVKGFYELAITQKTRGWKNQAERFFQAGDKDGFLKEQYAFFAKAIPEALRTAFQKGLPGKPGPKAVNGQQSQTSVNVPRGTQSVNGKNPTRVATMPKSGEVDLSKTSSEQIRNNQAYLKDGRLVQWA